MAIRYKINSVKLGKKRLFGQDKISFEFSYDVLYKNSDYNFFISKYSPVDVKDIYSGTAAASMLSKIDGLLVGIEGQSFSGVDIRHEDEWVYLTMWQPANRADWSTLLYTLHILQANTENPILDENNQEVSLRTIKDHMDAQVEYGHRQILELSLDANQTVTLNGILATIFLNQDLLEQHSTPDKLEAYLQKIQWETDAYIAHPSVFTLNGRKQVVSWTLTGNLKTVLPETSFSPPRLTNDDFSHEDIHHMLNFFDPDAEKSLGTYNFTEAMHVIRPHVLEKMDANNQIIQVDSLTLRNLSKKLTEVDIEFIVKRSI